MHFTMILYKEQCFCSLLKFNIELALETWIVTIEPNGDALQ